MIITEDFALARLVVGVFLSVTGLVLIIFHKAIRKWRDYWNSRDFPVGYGDMWSGKYTKAGLIITYLVTIVVGVIFCGLGILQIVRAITG
jgi:hypothetical protein